MSLIWKRSLSYLNLKIIQRVNISILALLFSLSTGYSQTFSYSIPIDIPDNDELCVQIAVSGLPGKTDTSFGLKRVCIFINHTYVAQLAISIKSPDGNEVLLSNHNGSNGQGYLSTCFEMNGKDGFILFGTSPFTGSYIPENSINELNNDQDPNGVWEICVKDEVPLDTGRLILANIEFGINPPVDPIPGSDKPCSFLNPLGCECPDGTSNCELLPDLIMSKQALLDDFNEFSQSLRVANAIANIGFGPLEVRGIDSCFCDNDPVPCDSLCPLGNDPSRMMKQRIYSLLDTTFAYKDYTAGLMGFHPDHQHVHTDNWVSNSIRIRGKDPAPQNWPIVGASSKISFCLTNLGSCDDFPGYCQDENGTNFDSTNLANAYLGQVAGCALNQGTYVGMLDIYPSNIPGQVVQLPPDICNGNYYFVSIVDPDNIVKEMNDSNNVTVIPFQLQMKQQSCFNVNFGADTIQGQAPLTVSFIDSSTAVPDEWFWDFGDGQTSTEQFPTHIYSDTGWYTVKLVVRSDSGYSDSLIRMNYIKVGEPISVKKILVNRFKIFPNPGKGGFRITGASHSQDNLVEVISIDGKLMIRKGNSGNDYWVSTVNLPKGTYFIRVNSQYYKWIKIPD